MTVIHVSTEPTLKKAFEKANYIHFDCTEFDEQDNLDGMYMRLDRLVEGNNADLLIFDMPRMDMLNENEFNIFSQKTTCIKVGKVLSAEFMTEIDNLKILLHESNSAKKATSKKKIVGATLSVIDKLF